MRPTTFEEFIEDIARRLYRAVPDEDGMKESWSNLDKYTREHYLDEAYESLVRAAMMET